MLRAMSGHGRREQQVRLIAPHVLLLAHTMEEWFRRRFVEVARSSERDKAKELAERTARPNELL